MNSSDRRIRHEEGDRSAAQSIGAGYPGGVQPHKHEAPGKLPWLTFRPVPTTSPQTTPGQSLLCSSLAVEGVSSPPSPSLPVLLLTAAFGTGKTSFLRLLLDTSVVSSRTTKDQLASVAKFVQGSSGHTAHLRTASIEINIDLDGNSQHQSLGLSLIDTPSLDFKDEATAERFLSETIRHIDARFAEGIEDVGAYNLLCDFLPPLIILSRTGKHRQATVTSICE